MAEPWDLPTSGYEGGLVLPLRQRVAKDLPKSFQHWLSDTFTAVLGYDD